MELWWTQAPWYAPVNNLFADMFWGLTVPGPKPGFWKREADETPKLGDPLPVALHVSSAARRPVELPAAWYKGKSHGGPALLNVVTVSLRWAPFDANYPVRRRFTALEPICTARFPADGAKQTVLPGEVFSEANSVKLFTIDLRDWFKVEREGHYEVAVKIDWKSLALHDRVYWNLECKRDFTVGKPPRLPSIEAFDKTVPVLGGPANQQRLQRLIKETVRPKPVEHKPLPAETEALLAWSPAVNGLAARIEYISPVWGRTVAFVRLKNNLNHPLTVPTANPVGAKKCASVQFLRAPGVEPVATDDASRAF